MLSQHASRPTTPGDQMRTAQPQALSLQHGLSGSQVCGGALDSSPLLFVDIAACANLSHVYAFR
jgi:hypothetical protein